MEVMICCAFFLFVSKIKIKILHLPLWHPEINCCVCLCHLNPWDPWHSSDSPCTLINKMQASTPPPKAKMYLSLYACLQSCNNSHKYNEVKFPAVLSFLQYSLYASKIIYNGNSEMPFTTEDIGPRPCNRTHVHRHTQLYVCNTHTQKRVLFT